MKLGSIQSKQEQLASQNALLKSQIATIKDKISQIHFIPSANNITENKNNDHLVTSVIKPLYYDEDEEILALAKKIDYYKDEIAKKKNQIENNIDLAKIKDLMNRIKEVKEKITEVESENTALVRVYNNQIKGINQTTMQLDFRDEEERLSNLIRDNKAKYKEKVLRNKQIDSRLKEQRLLYSNLNEKINKIKEKIKAIKLNENKRASINYTEEIAKLEEEILEEQSKIDKEEVYYNDIRQRQQMTIDKLTEEIIEKREVLKEKGNEIRMIQIQERNEKKKQTPESPPIYSSQSEKDSVQTKGEENKEESNSNSNGNGFFLTSNNPVSSEKEEKQTSSSRHNKDYDDDDDEQEDSRKKENVNQSEEKKDSNNDNKPSHDLIIINDIKNSNQADNYQEKNEETEKLIKNQNQNETEGNSKQNKDDVEMNNPNNGRQIILNQDQIESNPSSINHQNSNANQSDTKNPLSEGIEELKSDKNNLESLRANKSELDYGEGDE